MVFATVGSYGFRRGKRWTGDPHRVTGPYEKLPIPTDLEIVHITLLVDPQRLCVSWHDRAAFLLWTHCAVQGCFDCDASGFDALKLCITLNIADRFY